VEKKEKKAGLREPGPTRATVPKVPVFVCSLGVLVDPVLLWKEELGG